MKRKPLQNQWYLLTKRSIKGAHDKLFKNKKSQIAQKKNVLLFKTLTLKIINYRQFHYKTHQKKKITKSPF